MGLACIFGMSTSVKRVSVCNMGMMSCFLMRSGLMMFCRFKVMVGRFAVVSCGSLMMSYRLFDL